MATTIKFLAVLLVAGVACAPAWSQDAPIAEPPVDASAATADDAASPPPAEPTVDSAVAEPAPSEPAEGAGHDEAPHDAIDTIAERVDQSPEAQQARAGLLKPIYALAEKFSFPAFHAIAFGLMVAGVVSFALQLVLGKLVVLSRLSISMTEILSDALGLAVSLVGLVLTTQAAAENSTFTSSAFAVLGATAVGALAGLIFYVWGQRQELQAVEGRRAAARRDLQPPAKRTS